MGRLDIPDPRDVKDTLRGKYDISRSLIVRRSREFHQKERIRSIRRTVQWLLAGALLFAAARSACRAAGEKYGYLEPEKPPPATAADASLPDPDSDSEQGRAAPRP